MPPASPASPALLPAPPTQVVHVFPAAAIYVTWGANLGDGMGAVEELCLGDIYQLDPRAEPLRLALAGPELGAKAAGAKAASSAQRLGPGSRIGAEGDLLTLCARLTLMAPEGESIELLLLRHHAGDEREESGHYLLPLTPMAPRTEYALIAAEDPPDRLELSDLMCLSFLRGTRIMMASGLQRPIETLAPGDLVLSRDHGPQPIRWIGRSTLRARGAFAPVVISAGTLGNDSDLALGPHHRLFHYQRGDLSGPGTPETLVQAQHLLDDDRIFRREGGFAEYFSLVFDRHEIIYAEGVAAESLLVSAASVAALPRPLAEALRSDLPGLSQDPHFGIEADAGLARTIRRQRLG